MFKDGQITPNFVTHPFLTQSDDLSAASHYIVCLHVAVSINQVNMFLKYILYHVYEPCHTKTSLKVCSAECNRVFQSPRMGF